MSSMGEQHIEVTLPAYLTGELAEAETKEIEAHLAGCDRCSKVLHELSLLRETLASDPQPEPLEPVWTAIDGKLRPAVTERFNFRVAVSAVAAAAGIMLGIYMGTVEGPTQTEPSYPLWSAVGSSFSGEGSMVSRLYTEVAAEGDN